MADLFENPAGLDGFEFIEFSAPERGTLEPIFEMMGCRFMASGWHQPHHQLRAQQRGLLLRA